jgi:O-acetyl-ADP-ribose deacetylase (regulator of RNase III)
MITVRLGALHEAGTQAVLRPVRSDLGGITQASRRLETAAGENVRKRLDGMGELPMSSAVLTPGGDLAIGFIIHAVLESPEESPSAIAIQRALINGLRRALEWEMTSLALPPLGLGVGMLDPEDGARMMIEVLLDHLREGEPPRELVIVVESPYEEELFRRLVAAAGSA